MIIHFLLGSNFIALCVCVCVCVYVYVCVYMRVYVCVCMCVCVCMYVCVCAYAMSFCVHRKINLALTHPANLLWMYVFRQGRCIFAMSIFSLISEHLVFVGGKEGGGGFVCV